MASKGCKFTVEGRFPFPVDMLRYDCCYPADGASAAVIVDSQHPRKDDERGKAYTAHLYSNVLSSPTHARWESFGWHVLKSERLF